jgi:hypothetical protein
MGTQFIGDHPGTNAQQEWIIVQGMRVSQLGGLDKPEGRWCRHTYTQSNTEWIFTSFTAEQQSEQLAYYDEEYSQVNWTLRIQRHPNYHLTVSGIEAENPEVAGAVSTHIRDHFSVRNRSLRTFLQ